MGKKPARYVIDNYHKFYFDNKQFDYMSFRDMVYRRRFKDIGQNLHRIGGPALQHTYHKKSCGYYIWGKQYTKKGYFKAMKFLKDEGYIAFKLKYG